MGGCSFVIVCRTVYYGLGYSPAFGKEHDKTLEEDLIRMKAF